MDKADCGAAAPGRPKQGTAPSGGSAVRAATSVGATVRRAGPPQASTAPSGGSAAHAVASVGVTVRRAGPSQASTAPSGGSAAHAVASVGAHYLAVDLGWLSSTLTLNWPARIAFSLARTLAITSAGIFFSNVPSGASSEPLCFIIE